MIDAKGLWVSISFKIKREVRDLSPIELPLSHTFLFLCTDFCRGTVRGHTKLYIFECILEHGSISIFSVL